MILIHVLADAGQEPNTEYYVECTCGLRTWGDTDGEAFEAYLSHKRIAQMDIA
jgi:hypothetical protein